MVVADLLETAHFYFNDYEFYQIDISCNQAIFTEIFGPDSSETGFMVFHAKNQSYVVLRAKLSRQVFDKFLNANLRDKKKLPFRTLANPDAMLRKCNIVRRKYVESDSL